MVAGYSRMMHGGLVTPPSCLLLPSLSSTPPCLLLLLASSIPLHLLASSSGWSPTWTFPFHSPYHRGSSTGVALYPKAGLQGMDLSCLHSAGHLMMVCHPEISAALSLCWYPSLHGVALKMSVEVPISLPSFGKDFWWKLSSSPLGLSDSPHIKVRTVICLIFLVQMCLVCVPTLLPLLSEIKIIPLVTVFSLIVLDTDYCKWQGEITMINCPLCSPVFMPSLGPTKRKRCFVPFSTLVQTAIQGFCFNFTF